MVKRIEAPEVPEAPPANDSGVRPESLDSIISKAEGLEAGAAATPGQVQPLPPDPAAEAREMIDLVWSVAGPFMPDRYAVRYGPEQRESIAVNYAKVAEKRGWDVSDMLGRWGPEIGLAAALVGPALPVIVAEVKARRDAAARSGTVAAVADRADGVTGDA